MRRALSRAAQALAALLVSVAAPAAAVALTAGAAVAPITPPDGTPLGGYGSFERRLWVPDVLGRYAHAFWLRPATGTRDRLAARALVLDDGAARVAWVAVDLVAVDGALTRDVTVALARAGVPAATLLLSASHTHSGPGAFIESPRMAVLAMDRLDADVRRAIVEAVVAAVRLADRARVPARLGAGSAEAPALTTSRLARPLDPEVIALRVTTNTGAPIAIVWNYAIHGTMLGPHNLRFSADVMGRASTTLERALGVPALFVNGAVGDVSPSRHGEDELDVVGDALADAARRAWERARPAAATLAIAARTVALAPARLSLHNCAGGWLPRVLTLSLPGGFRRDAPLIAVAAGDVAWITVPGELQTALGLDLKREGHALFSHVIIAGVSNDYLGYFVSADDFARAGYVTCASIHGPGAGACVADTAIGLLYRLRGRRAPDAPRCAAG